MRSAPQAGCAVWISTIRSTGHGRRPCRMPTATGGGLPNRAPARTRQAARRRLQAEHDNRLDIVGVSRTARTPPGDRPYGTFTTARRLRRAGTSALPPTTATNQAVHVAAAR